MEYEVINGKKCMIGRGEKVAFRILERLFPDATLTRQVLVSALCILENPGKRMEEETIDIVMYHKNRTIAIRVQNDKGSLKLKHESRMRTDLEANRMIVVDLNEYDCPNLFTDRLNYLSMMEVTNALFKAKVPP